MTDNAKATEETDDGLRLEDKAEISIRQRLAVLEEWATRANQAIRALGFAIVALVALTALMLFTARKGAPA